MDLGHRLWTTSTRKFPEWAEGLYAPSPVHDSISILLVFQIVIPFFSLLIKDIYFLNEGCASRLPDGHINFEVSCVLVSTTQNSLFIQTSLKCFK